MAIPKVFVSSTCFDLGEVRDQLKKFIESFGFDAVLSEYGDVFYHPDLHTHDACIQEVSHCQLFILIIGGRFGGEYEADKSKSITNAEYIAAKESKIPIFTYIKKDVLSSQFLYKQNKDQEFAGKINYPAIDKQEHALDIFTFMNDVQKANTNNGVESFDNFQDIEGHLKKQWAGMFFDFLKTREVKNQIDATNNLLKGLQQSHNQAEELIKSLYISLKPKVAEENIELLERKNNIEEWYLEILGLDLFHEINDINLDKINVNKISKISPTSKGWYYYLVDIGLYKFINNNEMLEPIFFHEHQFVFELSDDDKYNIAMEKRYQDLIVGSQASARKEVLEKIINEALSPSKNSRKKDRELNDFIIED